MRHGTDNPGPVRRVAAALAAAMTTLTLFIAPAAAVDTPPIPAPPVPLTPRSITPACPDTRGSGGAIDQNGGAVVGTCWGNTPGSGPGTSASSAATWNWYGCDQWRRYSPGSFVSALRPMGELLLEDIIARGLDPTVTYVWHNVECTYVVQGGGVDGSDLTETWEWGADGHRDDGTDRSACAP